jgi:hypothetical protein
MRTCLYGEFQDSEYFDVGVVEVTDALDDYMSELYELIAVSSENTSKSRTLDQACF